MRTGAGIVVGLVLSGFTALLLQGTYAFEGPVVLRVTYEHGLHAGDLLLLVGWAVAMGALALLVRRPRARDVDRPSRRPPAPGADRDPVAPSGR